MKTIIVWYRNDLRVHDHPALSIAAKDGDHVVPVFIWNEKQLTSANRTRFLHECLDDLQASLKKRGANLVHRTGDALEELQKLAEEVHADAVYYTADYTPFALERDKKIHKQLDIEFRSFPGRLAVSNLDNLHTKVGTPHKVFSPFWRNWQQIQRREVAATPAKLSLPSSTRIGTAPKLEDYINKLDLSPNVAQGGETVARKRLHAFLDHQIEDYKNASNDMAADNTSRLSPYFHFGCLSPREIEDMLPNNEGARSWHRQLAWREFYHYVIFNFPKNRTQTFQERFRNLKWNTDKKLLEAWQQGKTGYPAVDAAMRQLNDEGFMHNRGRLIVGSFLTKDLWLNWKEGEQYFERMLLDGDVANNNGNWQWIASVGVDPAPAFRRLYNPASQRKNYDPTGAYVRKYLPELKDVPEKYLSEPWTMPEDIQKESNCIIGKDYPAPIVDHKQARLYALEQYRNA